MAVIGIIVFCGVIIGATAWLWNRPERPKDPEEDREQEENILRNGAGSIRDDDEASYHERVFKNSIR